MGIAALLAVKIVCVGATGLSVGSVLKMFHTYEWSSKKNKKELITDGKGESLRERASRLS